MEHNNHSSISIEKEEAKTTPMTLHHIFWYLVIFSVLGLLIETFYCYFTTGVWESRKGLLWGPFCPVYGFGATVLILLLNRYKNKKIKLFIVAAILGNSLEYLMSYILESVYGSRFWDYSYLNFNLNGRICFLYSIFWGILGILLILLAKPFIDQIISKLESKLKTGVEIAFAIFLIIDSIATVWAVSSYQNRARDAYMGILGTDKINTKRYEIETTLFPDKNMVKTFPNLRFVNEKGEEIWIKDLL